MAVNKEPIQCDPLTNGLAWHDFVAVSQEPGSCEGETEASWELSYLGYIVEMNPDPPAMLSRMVYRAEVVNYFSDLTEVEPPNRCPTYEAILGICFNRPEVIMVQPLISPPAGQNSRWLLDKEELIPYMEQGSKLMAHRLTYICEGPWYIIDWNGRTTSPYGGSGFAVTAEYDPEPNVSIWEHATIQHQKHSPEIRYNSAPEGWLKNPTTPQILENVDKKAYLQKMIKCNITKYIYNITAITSPTCEIPLSLSSAFIQAHNNSENYLDILTPDEDYTNGRFRISSESLIPHSTKGGKMIEWQQEYTYQCDPVFYSTIYNL